MKLKDPVFLVHPRGTHFNLQSRYKLSSLYDQFQKMTGTRELGEAEFTPHITSVLIRVESIPRGLLPLIRSPRVEDISFWMMPCHIVTFTTDLKLGHSSRRLKGELIYLRIHFARATHGSGIVVKLS